MATNAGSPLPDSADCAPALACPNASTNLAANLTPGTIRRVHETRRSHFTINYRVLCPGGVGRESLPRRSSLCACSHRIERRARPPRPSRRSPTAMPWVTGPITLPAVMVPSVVVGQAGWSPPPHRNIDTPPATLRCPKCRWATARGDDRPRLR